MGLRRLYWSLWVGFLGLWQPRMSREWRQSQKVHVPAERFSHATAACDYVE